METEMYTEPCFQQDWKFCEITLRSRFLKSIQQAVVVFGEWQTLTWWTMGNLPPFMTNTVPRISCVQICLFLAAKIQNFFLLFFPPFYLSLLFFGVFEEIFSWFHCILLMSVPLHSLCWASWPAIHVGSEMKAFTFLMNTATLMHFEFLFGLSREKVNPAATIISIFYRLIQALKHLKDDWQVRGWKTHCLGTFHCKLVFEISSAVTAPENVFVFFFSSDMPPGAANSRKKCQFENFNWQHYESYCLLSIDIRIFSHSSLSPTLFSPHLKGLVSLPAGRDWLPNCTGLAHCSNRIIVNNTKKLLLIHMETALIPSACPTP